MMKRHVYYGLLGGLVALSFWATIGHAAMISVPNGDFETIPPDPNLDGDNDYETGDIRPPWRHDNTTAGNRIYDSTETWTDPSTYFAGWANTGAQSSAGRYGLQQPAASYYARTAGSQFDPLNSSFNGNFIGFINLDDADLFTGYAQSAVLGQLKPGEYAATVAVGARANQGSWNDVTYTLSLVSNPIASGPGTTGGVILGTPAVVTLVPAAAASGSNIQDLTYTLTVNPGDVVIGSDFAIRIRADNALMENGVPDPVDGDQQFSQGNFDNVRLEFIPEPGSLALAALSCGLGLVIATRRPRH